MIEGKLYWKEDPVKLLDGLKKNMRNKFLRIAMNKGGAVVKDAVASKATRQSGALQKSLRIKVKNYQTGNVWVCVVGPKSSFTMKYGGKVGRDTKGRFVTAIKSDIRKPSRYITLLEFGTKKMAKRPLLLPALQASKSRYQQTVIDKIRSQIANSLPKA